MAAVTVDVLTNQGALESLRHEWSDLAPAAHTQPWLTHSWAEACATAFAQASSAVGTQSSLRIFTVRRSGTLAAVAPLVLKKSCQPIQPMRLDFLGGEELKEPNGFVFSDDSSLIRLAEAIAAEPTYPIRLSRIPTRGKMLSHLRRALKSRGWITTTMNMAYPFVDLTRGGSSLLKKSLSEDLRRARRKAEKSGEVTLETVDAGSVLELDCHLQRALQIEASGWKGKNKTAILCNDSRRAFFERLAVSSLYDRTLRLAFLRVGDRHAAVQFAVESCNQYWLLNVGYREDARVFSPGNLLLEETIRASSGKGLARYNFLGKEEPWTRRWTSNLEDCVVLAAYRPNLFGLRAILSDAIFLLNRRRRDRLVQALKGDSSRRCG